jgi:hypothetical protein
VNLLGSVVLGVDQATTSGWSIHVARRPVVSGKLDVWSWQARREVLRMAYDLANEKPGYASNWAPRWFVFAYENHSDAPLKSYKSTPQVMSLGGSRDLWFDSLNRLGHPENLRIGTTSRTWRSKVLGLKAALAGYECKAQAVRWAVNHTGKAGIGHDEAEAICVAAWGSLDGCAELERIRFVGAAKMLRQAK